MARTTFGQVQGLLLGDYDHESTPSLNPFIETASALVDDVAICARARGKPLNSTRLEIIERWLAAHFYVMNDQAYSQKQTERASGRFQGQTGMYLEASKYGQTAVNLDSSGCLYSIASGTRRVAGLIWLGKVPSDQIDYRQRD